MSSATAAIASVPRPSPAAQPGPHLLVHRRWQLPGSSEGSVSGAGCAAVPSDHGNSSDEALHADKVVVNGGVRKRTDAGQGGTEAGGIDPCVLAKLVAKKGEASLAGRSRRSCGERRHHPTGAPVIAHIVEEHVREFVDARVVGRDGLKETVSDRADRDVVGLSSQDLHEDPGTRTSHTSGGLCEVDRTAWMQRLTSLDGVVKPPDGLGQTVGG